MAADPTSPPRSGTDAVSVRGGSIAATQARTDPLAVRAAPTTGKEFNTLGERLLPKACFKLEDLRFEFDSSFVLPAAAEELPELQALIERHTDGDVPPPLGVFGHADPVGNDDYNKQLSGRRATAIYAMLVRDTALWDQLFTQPLGRDDWGKRALDTMKARVGSDPGSRQALFRAYMDSLCGPGLLLDKQKHFLARNADPAGKGDFQGCGEFNPILMFSKAESDAFAKASDKGPRNLANAPNRRVTILLFAPGRRVNPSFWPCPRAKEGTAACTKRFFPDAAKRRTFQAERREFSETRDTFACRLYQLLTDDSPCERVLPVFKIRLFDADARALPEARFLVKTATRAVPGIANAEGDALVTDLRVPATCEVFWSRKPREDPPPPPPVRPEDFDYSLTVNVTLEDLEAVAATDADSLKRLHNLGYSRHASTEENVREFQIDIGKQGDDVTGKLDDIREEVRRRHDALDPPLRPRLRGKA